MATESDTGHTHAGPVGASVGGEAKITVEVAYGLPERQFLEALEVPVGTTAAQAVEASGLREAFPDVVVESGGIGIFSRVVPPDQVLAAGDRVEVYRPLLIDPKEARRARAEAAKKP